jgi:SpoVK/Ycf46/Vps4 family AAA+-type ATPase
MVNARLVEAYLERACARYYARVGTAQDRLVLDADDFTGLAEEIEPALRAPGDVDAYLDRLGNMIGLDDVRQTVDGLVAEARLAAERAAQGLPTGTASRHLIFVGGRGTGKATVAGQVGGIYAALGLLDSGHVVACRPAHLAGRDRSDTAAKVSLHVDQAMGGVLLIQGADRLGASRDAVDELLRFMDERRDKFMVICTGTAPEIDEFLLANPGFRAEFGAIVEFRGPTARELVRMFQRFAERDLYMLDEELRVELLTRFGRLRDDADFANAHTVRAMFEATVARQAARLAQAQVNAATAARLSVHDLPEDSLEQMLGGLREASES